MDINIWKTPSHFSCHFPCEAVLAPCCDIILLFCRPVNREKALKEGKTSK